MRALFGSAASKLSVQERRNALADHHVQSPRVYQSYKAPEMAKTSWEGRVGRMGYNDKGRPDGPCETEQQRREDLVVF